MGQASVAVIQRLEHVEGAHRPERQQYRPPQEAALGALGSLVNGLEADGYPLPALWVEVAVDIERHRYCARDVPECPLGVWPCDISSEAQVCLGSWILR
jgi:hypothetical protein